MELYEASGQYELALRRKAEVAKLPLGGGMELLPLCNMSCNMCYIQQNTEEIRHSLLRKEDWLAIAAKARDAGVLFILLTGGEPLLHPDFKEIYLAMQQMGFILTVNTNGTLIDEEWADFFAAHPCRRLNVTVYGAGNHTYQTLCHNPYGFDQVMRGLRLLKERQVNCRINITLTKENRQELKQIVGIARTLEMLFMPATYIFRSVSGLTESRMSPYEAAETRLEAVFLSNPEADRVQQARLLLENVCGPLAIPSYQEGFSCTAGRSGYWINWQGILTPCCMIDAPGVDLKTRSFTEGWQEIIQRVSRIETCRECKICRKKFFCQSCAAASYVENGNFTKKPEYLCELTDAMIDILLTYLAEEERQHYKEILGK